VATQYLDDSFGPDSIRVTVAVEPAVDRFVRARDQWTAPGFTLLPARDQLRNLLPGVVQDTVLGDAWAVVVEADSGQRVRRTCRTRDDAWALAQSIARSVRVEGVSALADLDQQRDATPPADLGGSGRRRKSALVVRIWLSRGWLPRDRSTLTPIEQRLALVLRQRSIAVVVALVWFLAVAGVLGWFGCSPAIRLVAVVLTGPVVWLLTYRRLARRGPRG
jgi:hypothetical protein